MKFSFTENDRSTAMDEVIILVFIIACIAAGLALFITGPGLWVIKPVVFRIFGLCLIAAGILIIPSLITRLKENDKK